MRGTGADFAAFLRYAKAGDDLRYASIDGVGSEAMVDLWETMVGATVFRGDFDVTSPAPRDVNNLISLSEAQHTPSERRALRIWSRFYEPFGVTDQLRALLYHERELVGWVGLVKRRGRFHPRAKEVVEEEFDRILSAFAEVHELVVGDRPTSYLLFDEVGDLRAQSGLPAEQRADIVSDVRKHVLAAARREAHCGGRFVVGRRYHGRVVRLVPDETSGYVAKLTPLEMLRLPWELALTDRQREVAALLTTQQTMDELAATLGITRDGVKYHVGEVYSRLGVDNRVELRCEIGDHEV